MRLLVFICCILITAVTLAQTDSVGLRIDPVQVIARPSEDSVVLRWAPIKSNIWMTGNVQGYFIERYTLVRDGKALAQPEKHVLTEKPIRPLEEELWMPIVNTSKYVAIAAQALLGETFEMNMEKGGAFDIVNKVKETEQRFSIALLCADLVPQAAKALGLYYADKTIVKGERYLYRIILNDNSKIQGSVFADTEENTPLPQPVDFSLELQGSAVVLTWDQSYHKRIYTAYYVERSDNGVNFTALSEDPIVTLSTAANEVKFQYASDTLPDMEKEYYYRIRGISPFGEMGPPSEVRTIRAKPVITTIPNITSALNIDNSTILIEWEFPVELNRSIQGFYIERALSHTGQFSQVNSEVIEPPARSFRDLSPDQTNYYRVAVLISDNERLNSFPYFIHLIDSVPPSAPIGLQANVDDNGVVNLSWKASEEPDIFGYRIYRANYESEEFAQITAEAITQPTYKDKVELQSINRKIHYRLMAIDRNQNHSELSDIYSFQLPDKIPPVTPVFLPVNSSFDGVELRWIPSPSEDVIRYDVYRKGDQNEWIRLSSLSVCSDTLCVYQDNSIKNGEHRFYTVVAVDGANLESAPAAAVRGDRIKRNVWPAVKLDDPEIDRANNRVHLKWSYDQENVRIFQIYRAVNNNHLTLYSSVSGNEFSDRVTPGTQYMYKVMAVYHDGSRSELGNGVTLVF